MDYDTALLKMYPCKNNVSKLVKSIEKRIEARKSIEEKGNGTEPKPALVHKGNYIGKGHWTRRGDEKRKIPTDEQAKVEAFSSSLSKSIPASASEAASGPAPENLPPAKRPIVAFGTNSEFIRDSSDVLRNCGKYNTRLASLLPVVESVEDNKKDLIRDFISRAAKLYNSIKVKVSCRIPLRKDTEIQEAESYSTLKREFQDIDKVFKSKMELFHSVDSRYLEEIFSKKEMDPPEKTYKIGENKIERQPVPVKPVNEQKTMVQLQSDRS